MCQSVCRGLFSALYHRDKLLALRDALTYGLLFVPEGVRVVHSHVALAVGSGADARLRHLDLNPTVSRGAALRGSCLIRCTVYTLPTDLATFEVDRLGDEEAELLAGLMRVELAVGQVELSDGLQ